MEAEERAVMEERAVIMRNHPTAHGGANSELAVNVIGFPRSSLINWGRGQDTANPGSARAHEIAPAK